jgi:hypothetical protein
MRKLCILLLRILDNTPHVAAEIIKINLLRIKAYENSPWVGTHFLQNNGYIESLFMR